MLEIHSKGLKQNLSPALWWPSLLLSRIFHFHCGLILKSYGVRFRLKMWWVSRPDHLPERVAGCHKITGVMMLDKSHDSACLRRGKLTSEVGCVGALFWVSWKTYCDEDLYEEQDLWKRKGSTLGRGVARLWSHTGIWRWDSPLELIPNAARTSHWMWTVNCPWGRGTAMPLPWLKWIPERMQLQPTYHQSTLSVPWFWRAPG